MTWPTIQACFRRKTDSFILKVIRKRVLKNPLEDGRLYLPILKLCSLIGKKKNKIINVSSHIRSIRLAVHVSLVSYLILIGQFWSDSSVLPSFRIILSFCHSLWPGKLGRRLCQSPVLSVGVKLFRTSSRKNLSLSSASSDNVGVDNKHFLLLPD